MVNLDDPVAGPFTLPGLNRKHYRRGTDATIVNRLPMLKYLPHHFRSHCVAMIGEFVGTFLFLFFALSGTQVANTQDYTISQAANPAKLLYIGLCFGFSLAVNAWVFFRISGGLFNPAVTLGLCLVGALTYIRGALVFISQVLGGIAAAGVVAALFPGPLAVKTTLRPGTSISRGLFIEMFLTSQLVFTIFMLAAEKHKATFIAPVGIGLSLFIAELSGVFYTGGSLNPVRTFGPCVISHSFEHYHWIYWLGPILGSVLASSLYKLMKMLEYETANPGQDFDEHEKEHFDPEKHTIRPPPVVNFQPSTETLHDKHEEDLAAPQQTNQGISDVYDAAPQSASRHV
ncbi:Aquaporin-1 [Lecanora helva]